MSDIIAHNQELLNCNYNLWFYICLSLPAAVMSDWELRYTVVRMYGSSIGRAPIHVTRIIVFVIVQNST
jgi:glucan phosphoethanolaminetransferase (alkaline phosphatase superfamily)